MSNENNQQNSQTPESQERKKKISRAVGIIVAIIVIVALAGAKWTKRTDTTGVNTQVVDGCKPGYLFSETTGKPCPQADDTIRLDSTPKDEKTSSSGYEDALTAYAGKVVLFDASCKASPATASFTLGTRILIANNSTETLTIAVGDKSESLAPYHYYTTALKAAGEIKALCNGAPGATITVK